MITRIFLLFSEPKLFNDPELLELWKKLSSLTPFPEIEKTAEDNLAKYNQTARYFRKFRDEKVWQEYRSDVSRGFDGYSQLSGALDILKK